MNIPHRPHETEALALAIKASLQDQVEAESMRIAQEIHRAEIEASDQKLACALEEAEVIEFSAKRKHEDLDPSVMNKTIEDSKKFRSEERHSDSWDCSRCTFRNIPYRPKCEICHSSAPQHVLTFEEIPSNIRFGLEIELFIPEGKRDGFTLEHIAEQLTGIGPPIVKFRSYTHETTDYWKIVTDSSIDGDSDQEDICLELVSPILLGDGGLESLRVVMENVRRLGIGTNATCSFHVHVDCENESKLGSLTALKRIARRFVQLENAFDLLVSLTWDDDRVVDKNNARRANRNQYCRSNRLAFGQRSNRQRWDLISSVRSKFELVHLINPGGNRYYKLNMTNVVNSSRPSTCEFRHHGGVDDLREAEAWVRLIILFCCKATCDNKGATARPLPENTLPKHELSMLFNLVGCRGLEQYFTIERRLFTSNGDRLQNDW
eukprot:CAMPEP_0113301180 /NCGR_PEP_ID=MMETSP0010_2-20120614/2514_1 /TAXON_ID=216773 ORGANISM="Corethron hystrix, Strain 308" /NCGR_SAMPLE_ID=MMETSP0010_2 /ASSEMBLY_ACC=CAM_ASM_000155 /LENGTH=434 /DNA_ID=CAMNT_0000154755 /DNA_START=23 /DNA_END=1324 /DNA_ORIENTATION=+ /assembly_acc=CAM_ASM_000155